MESCLVSREFAFYGVAIPLLSHFDGSRVLDPYLKCSLGSHSDADSFSERHALLTSIERFAPLGTDFFLQLLLLIEHFAVYLQRLS